MESVARRDRWPCRDRYISSVCCMRKGIQPPRSRTGGMFARPTARGEPVERLSHAAFV